MGGRKRRMKADADDENWLAEVAEEAAPSKTNKKKKGSKKPTAEQRVDATGKTVRYSASANQNTRERIYRALPGSGHRMFLLDRKTVAPLGSEGGPVEEFAILGATANVYQVRVGRHPYCSCPDAAKGNMCKHYLYVMIRVLRLDQNDPLVWQRALLTSEAEEVLSGKRSTARADGVMASAAVCAAYRRAAGGGGDEAEPEAPPPAGRPVEGDCPICFDDLVPCGDSARSRVVTCNTCGNHTHEECFRRWTAQKKAAHQSVTCVNCRAPWPEAPADAGEAGSAGAYINLKGVSELHRGADMSLEGLYGENARWIRYRGSS